jgi:hypothetical protein
MIFVFINCFGAIRYKNRGLFKYLLSLPLLSAFFILLNFLISSTELSWATRNSLDYDKEKYKEMLLDAAETVLEIFGFDRILFGKPRDKKCWMQLRRNRISDVKAEINS